MIGTKTAVALLLLAAVVHGYTNLGDNCYYDEECDTITTFCRERRVCACKERFREAEGRCVATVGARCTSSYDCGSLPDSQCSDDKVCECREGYVRDQSYFRCLPVIMVYKGQCEEHEQCQESFGDVALCQENSCRCRDSYHFADGKCHQSKGLGDGCQNDSDCSYNEDERHKVQCRSGSCQCRDGYRRDDRVCIDGATQATLSILAVLVMFVVRIL